MDKKKIGIFVKWDEAVQKKAEAIKKWMSKKCILVEIDKTKNIPNDLLCIIVLGGDGTFLSAARLIGNQKIPLIGIKFGEVGFLAEIIEDFFLNAVQSILDGNFKIENRTRLNVSVQRKKQIITSVDVLNDAVINKSAISRLTSLAVYIDENYLTTFRADGLIIGTPTGSTGYSLAAGGPVIHPAVPGIILTPICPFTLTNRPLIIPDNSKIQIKFKEKIEDIVLTLDGQEGVKIKKQDSIIIEKSRYPVKMIYFEEHNYYNVLKTRLLWSGGKV